LGQFLFLTISIFIEKWPNLADTSKTLVNPLRRTVAANDNKQQNDQTQRQSQQILTRKQAAH